MSPAKTIPGLRALGGIIAAAIAIMPRQVHGVLPQNKLCREMLLDANATGRTSFLSEQISALEKLDKGGPGNKELSWTVTLNAPGSAGASDYEHTIWLGIPRTINLDDGALPFSGCAFAFTDLPYNTILRANTAPSGDCAPTFGDDCVNALIDRAQSIADGLTGNCGTASRSNCSITEICPTIFSQLGSQHNLPAECVPFFDVGTNDRAWPSANVTAITSNVGDHSKEPCWITPDGMDQYTFVPTFSLTDDNRKASGELNADNESYDNLTSTPYPIMTVFMPPANGTRSAASLTPSRAQMRCVRAEEFSQGSRGKATLPQPTEVAVPGKVHLTTGVIAGVAVGAAVFVALIILAGICLWRRRRRAKDRAEATRLYGESQSSMASKLASDGSIFTASSPSGMLSHQGSLQYSSEKKMVHEAPYNNNLDASGIAELPSDALPRPIELNGMEEPSEVAAHEARVRQSLMSAVTTTTTGSAWPLHGAREPYEPPLPAVPSEHSSPHKSSRTHSSVKRGTSQRAHDYASEYSASPLDRRAQSSSPPNTHNQQPGEQGASRWSATTRGAPMTAFSPNQSAGGRPSLPPLRTDMQDDRRF